MMNINIGSTINSFTIIDHFFKTEGFEDVWYFRLKCKCGNMQTHKIQYILNNVIKACGDKNPEYKVNIPHS